MKMKKVLAMVMAATMVLGMVSCSDDDDSSKSKKKNKDESTVSTVDDSTSDESDTSSDESDPDTESDAESDPDSSEKDPDESKKDPDESKKDPDESKKDPDSSVKDPVTSNPDKPSDPGIPTSIGSSGTQVGEVSAEGLGANTLIDNAECTMRIKEIKEKGSFGGYSIIVEAVNKTSDKTLNFEWNDCSINNYYANPFLSISLKPGETRESDATFFSTDIKQYAITKVSQIKGSFRVFDPSSYFDSIYEGSFTIYPYGKSSAVEKSYKPDGKKLIDKSGVLMYAIEGRNDNYGYKLINYFENNTGKPIHIFYTNFKVNGKEVDGMTTNSRLVSGQMLLSDVSWTASKLEEAGLTPDAVNKIEFDVEIADYDERGNVIANEHAVLNF